MPKQPLMSRLIIVLATIGAATLAVPAAQASIEHPQLWVSAEKKKGGVKVPVLGWGQIQLKNRFLGTLECVNLVYGASWNESEFPGGSEKAYGEVLEWTGTSFASVSGLELGARCRSSQGQEAWAAVEPALEKEYERVVNTEGKERSAIKQVKREIPSVPWKTEAFGTELNSTAKSYVRVGVPLSSTERTEIEQQEASVGVPPERRSGCYPQPALTEVVRQPGITNERESELVARRDPPGCIRVDIVAPFLSLEIIFQGTLEPEAVNGTRNALTPSKGEFKGGYVSPNENEVPSEHSSERNEYYLSSGFGKGYTKALTPIKEVGFLKEELLQLK